ncbi:MAG: YqeG family HAD IIIA-type phosphatase [Oscillospiraceae bacterium]|nr:YqeG family HAD IIIA-type phosphatase [Oscillospiraceae bacterium]
MSFSFLPDIRLDTVYDITAQELKNRGIKLLLLDIDNTLLPYSIEMPDEILLAWLRGLERAGICLFIISNNRSQRPHRIAPRLGIDYVAHAKKPSPRAALEAMSRFGVRPEETAAVGDQVYIDVLMAHRCGALAIVVEPIKFTNPLLFIRYLAEVPIRIFRKRGFNNGKTG